MRLAVHRHLWQRLLGMHQSIHFKLQTFCRGESTFYLTDKWLFHWSVDRDIHSNDPICLVDSYTILLHWAEHVCNRKRRKGDDGHWEVQGVSNILHDILKSGSWKAILIFRIIHTIKIIIIIILFWKKNVILYLYILLLLIKMEKKNKKNKIKIK